MTTAVAKYAAKKMLSSEMNKYRSKKPEGPYDPYYEKIRDPRNPDKKKRVKKQIPAYIPSHDADVLARARKTAYRLDFALFNFMGQRFGWSSVIGLVPVVGDFADGFLAALLIIRMRQVTDGLPGKVQCRMIFNLIIDLLIGFVPFVGDLADAYLKCNGRNVRLLEKHLDKKYKPKRLTLEEKDMKYPPNPATAYEDFSDEEVERRETFDDRHDNVRRPTRAYSGRRERPVDEEMGIPRHDTHRSQRDKPSRHGTKSSRRH
ncbi:hypothetical protein CC80DRAFT_266627 [Byssothecium circinans]|uniref:Ph domain-containing protein n=1 Tax=Byssothecium circinans TaxID=147558 RepID=A0A6A5U865_9PLEO|nr:hypothetical protein CC80DRAFT_266627 [Byssothecium circinans]